MSIRSTAATIVVAVLAAILTVVAPQSSTAATTYTTAKCPHLLVLALRGSGQKFYTATSTASGGKQIQATMPRFMEQFRIKTGKSVRFSAVNYPAVAANPKTIASGAYAKSKNTGSETVRKAVVSTQKACGKKTKVALIGFSQGAHALSTVVRNPGSAEKAIGSTVAAVVLLADPIRRKDRDSGARRYGYGRAEAEFKGAGALSLKWQDKIKTSFAKKVWSGCHIQDNICNGSTSKPYNPAAGTHTTAYWPKAQATQTAKQMVVVLRANGVG